MKIDDLVIVVEGGTVIDVYRESGEEIEYTIEDHDIEEEEER